jgi:hypothetical protein
MHNTHRETIFHASPHPQRLYKPSPKGLSQKIKGRLAQVVQAHKQHSQALKHQRHPQNTTQLQLRLKTLIRVQDARTTSFSQRCTPVHSQKNKGMHAQVVQAHN